MEEGTPKIGFYAMNLSQKERQARVVLVVFLFFNFGLSIKDLNFLRSLRLKLCCVKRTIEALRIL